MKTGACAIKTVAAMIGSLIGRMIVGAAYTAGGYFVLWLIGAV
jgi:hypothetical protein